MKNAPSVEVIIEQRLRLHLGNICMAAIVGREGDLRTCKQNIIDDVAKMMREQAARKETANVWLEAAKELERARPVGGRQWSTEQAAVYEALTHIAGHFRSRSQTEGDGDGK